MELKLGVIGTGGIGRSHMERINHTLRGARVVACADVNEAFGKQVAEKYGCAFFAKGEDLIASPEVDAVLVCTTDEYHERYTVAAIRAGKYVLCEKPLAPQVDACRRIMEAEMAGGKKRVQVGFMRRYDTGYRQLKEALASGKYGEALLVHCAHRVPSMPPSYHTEMSVENSMIHEIDVLRWLLGEDYTTAQVVFGKQSRRAGEHLRDPQIMMLTTASGVRIDVEAFMSCQYAYDIKCEICCENGILSLPDPSFVVARQNAARIHPLYDDWTERFVQAYNSEVQAWIDATCADRVGGPTAWDGYIGQVTAAAASKARDTGMIVTIAPQQRPAFYDV